MKRLAIIALASSPALGAMIATCLKLDSIDNRWSRWGWPTFIVLGVVLGVVGSAVLLAGLGALSGSD